ncbi:hypothetical protein DACRYDRAFT_94372 [Dacryopinax primogenitus]|uniref:Uncharacterized protein n=1 Tax=Dacryopinax primogenitus (strain DJM 731) TaxID=1858805 RepID=M5FX55_DACPD|nr:uncharacterized protein DACRYDRAFT_94372 [Dacryopinax primogenitus]EJU02566.1 hypothetical protein DACRYDRAFT_94372 [Dacryopinax primogenitus]
MLTLNRLTLALALIGGILAAPAKRTVAYYNPNNGGGSEVDIVSPGLGEPLNVISDPLLTCSDLLTNNFLSFAQDVGFSTECLGIHLGDPQQANLGDGNGAVDQLVEYRENYNLGGTCLESLIGGNHLRGWIQNGPSANSGAWFLAVSQEENVAEGHNIVPNGYNIGRDNLVANANAWAADQSAYSLTVEYVSGLLPSGSNGINHGISQDGQVAVITVTKN